MSYELKAQKHELKFKNASLNPGVVGSNPRVTSPSPRMMGSNPWVTSSRII